MRSAEKCVVSAVLVKASELAQTVLGRMTVRSRFVYCVQVAGVVIKNSKNTTQVHHSRLECNYVFDF